HTSISSSSRHLTQLTPFTYITFNFFLLFFFFNDTAPPEISTLSLHDALPICAPRFGVLVGRSGRRFVFPLCLLRLRRRRSEGHTSELQSHSDLVWRLLLG